MITRRSLLTTALGSCTLLAGGSWLQTSVAAVPSIRVAANLPMSGPLATYGSSVRDGAVLALETLAKEPGPNIVVDWQDNGGDPASAFGIFQRQILADPTIYTSGVKPQTLAIADQVTERGLPHFVWIYDVKINNGTTNNLRTWVSFKIDAPIYVDYAVRRRAKKVSILYVQLPITVEAYERLITPGLRTRGITDIQTQVYDIGRSDFKDLAVKVKSFDPDLIILNGFQADLVGLIRALRPLSLINDGNTIASYDMLDAAPILGADEVEGIRVTAPLFTTRPDQGRTPEFTRTFKERFGKAPLYTNAFAYDMVSILKDAGRRAQPNPSPADWIRLIRATDLEGVTGRLRFDNDGDLMTPIEVGVYRSGRLVPDAGAQ